MGRDWHVATTEEVFYSHRHAYLNTAQIPPELMPVFYRGKADPGTPCLRERQCYRGDFILLVLLEVLATSQFF